MDRDVVRAFGSRHIGKGRFCIGTRQAGHLLGHRVGIGRHDAQALNRTGIEGDGGGPAISLAGISQDKGLGVGPITLRIDGTIVSPVEAGEPTHVRCAPVRNGGRIEGLVEDAFHFDGQREGCREIIVEGERGLPDLRQFELGIHGCDGGRNRAVFRGNGHGITQGLQLLEQGVNRGPTLTVRHQAAGEFIHGETVLLRITGVDFRTILDQAAIGGHVGEEHERETALEQAGTATDLQGLVAKHIPVESDTGGNNEFGRGPFAGIDVLLGVIVTLGIVVQFVNGIVGHQVGIVEEQAIQAQASSYLQVGRGIPFILGIDTGLVILDTGRRILFSVIAISKGDHLGGGSAHKV